jgi:hypothetical protein
LGHKSPRMRQPLPRPRYDGGGDAAQAKIILSANVRIQRLPRRLGIRLLGGAGDNYADRAWCAFVMHGDDYARRRQSETRPSFSSNSWMTRHLTCRLGRKSKRGDRLCVRPIDGPVYPLRTATRRESSGESLEILRRQGTSEQIALVVELSMLRQEGILLFRFDAFGDD